MGQKLWKKVLSLCNTVLKCYDIKYKHFTIMFRAKLHQMGQKLWKKVFILCNTVLKYYDLNVNTLLLCLEQSYIKWDKSCESV